MHGCDRQRGSNSLTGVWTHVPLLLYLYVVQARKRNLPELQGRWQRGQAQFPGFESEGVLAEKASQEQERTNGIEEAGHESASRGKKVAGH